MICVVHKSGTGFMGLMSYLMHDADYAKTSDRVSWAHGHNLVSDNVDLGCRIMCATSMNQEEIKKRAGVVNTGRKSKKHVMHYTLSWHPEEYQGLNKDEMLSAALGSLSYLGVSEGQKLGKKNIAKRTQYADQHQAIVVCHDEGSDKPLHVHVMVNRVHPEHGVMLPDSNDYHKLSAWASDYRKSQGKEHYCPKRQINAAKRAQGLLVNHPRKPRNVYEQDKALKDAPKGSALEAQIKEQKQRGKALKTEHEGMKRKNAVAMGQLEQGYIQSRNEHRQDTTEKIKQTKSQLKSDYAPKIDALTSRQSQEIEAFKSAKDSVKGRLKNSWEALKTKEWVHDVRQKPVHAIAERFEMAFSSGLQQKNLEHQHSREQSQLKAQRLKEEKASVHEIRIDEGFKRDELRQKYTLERNDLLFKHSMQKAKINAQWHQLEKDQSATQADEGKHEKTIEQDHSYRPNKMPAYDIPADQLRQIGRDLREQQTNDVGQYKNIDQNQGIER